MMQQWVQRVGLWQQMTLQGLPLMEMPCEKVVVRVKETAEDVVQRHWANNNELRGMGPFCLLVERLVEGIHGKTTKNAKGVCRPL